MVRSFLHAFLILTTALAALAGDGRVPGRRQTAAPLIPPPRATSSPWRVEIATDGGFTGGGIGGIAVTSDGMLTVSLGSTSMPKTCTYPLPQSEISAIGDLVLQARAYWWTSSNAQAREGSECCDLIRFNLTLTRRETNQDGFTSAVTYKTYWFLFPHPAMPADLVKIANVLFSPEDPTSLRSRFMPLCTNTP